MADQKSVATKVRGLYDKGASINWLKNRFHLSQSEVEDICPEEKESHPHPEGIGGY